MQWSNSNCARRWYSNTHNWMRSCPERGLVQLHATVTVIQLHIHAFCVMVQFDIIIIIIDLTMDSYFNDWTSCCVHVYVENTTYVGCLL